MKLTRSKHNRDIFASYAVRIVNLQKSIKSTMRAASAFYLIAGKKMDIRLSYPSIIFVITNDCVQSQLILFWGGKDMYDSVLLIVCLYQGLKLTAWKSGSSQH